ncbi:MAG: hypothetical protein ACFFHD_11215 [Promethearchaeota archaeon]
MNKHEEKTFKCNLDDSNLFNCILNEVGGKDLDVILEDLPVIMDETIINCINASLIVCLRNVKKELGSLNVQVKLLRVKDRNWIISQINIIVSDNINDDILTSRINQCLKFLKRGCASDESIKFSIIKSESKEDLSYYKVKLLELNEWLANIREDNIKKENLFSLFKNIKLN